MENNIIEKLMGIGVAPKAHEQMDALIGQDEMQMLLKQVASSGNAGMLREFAGTMNPSAEINPTLSLLNSLSTGSSYESDPGILSEHTSLLNYLSGAVSEQGQQQYAYGLDEAGLQERMANIKKFPSSESRGKKYFTAPITQDDGSVVKESRQMEHWLQDYDYLFNRTALSKP